MLRRVGDRHRPRARSRRRIPTGHGVSGLAISPDGAHLYATDPTSDTVSVIDTAANTVTATVRTGPSPLGVAVSPDGRTAYVAEDSDPGTVAVIDTATAAVTRDDSGRRQPGRRRGHARRPRRLRHQRRLQHGHRSRHGHRRRDGHDPGGRVPGRRAVPAGRDDHARRPVRLRGEPADRRGDRDRHELGHPGEAGSRRAASWSCLPKGRTPTSSAAASR